MFSKPNTISVYLHQVTIYIVPFSFSSNCCFFYFVFVWSTHVLLTNQNSQVDWCAHFFHTHTFPLLSPTKRFSKHKPLQCANNCVCVCVCLPFVSVCQWCHCFVVRYTNWSWIIFFKSHTHFLMFWKGFSWYAKIYYFR